MANMLEIIDCGSHIGEYRLWFINRRYITCVLFRNIEKKLAIVSKKI